MTAATTITVRVLLTTRPRPGRKTVVTPGGLPGAVHTRADPALVKALARAHRWKRLLEEGRYASISEMAAVEKIDRGYLGQILQLTLLAPNIVEEILDGTQPADLMLPAVLKPFPAAWEQQRVGFTMPPEQALRRVQRTRLPRLAAAGPEGPNQPHCEMDLGMDDPLTPGQVLPRRSSCLAGNIPPELPAPPVEDRT